MHGLAQGIQPSSSYLTLDHRDHNPRQGAADSLLATVEYETSETLSSDAQQYEAW